MILKAAKIPPVRFAKGPMSVAQKRGVSFQKQFTRALKAKVPKGLQILDNQWYTYSDSAKGHGLICSPDIVIVDSEERFVIVVEVKTTYTPLAFEKLKGLYCPVVRRATGFPTKPIVVVKNLGLGDPRPSLTLSLALLSSQPLYQWLGRGPVEW